MEKLWHVLHDADVGPVIFSSRNNGPSSAAAGVVLGVSFAFPSCLAVALTAWAGQHHVMLWDFRPVRLMQILTKMLRVWVV